MKPHRHFRILSDKRLLLALPLAFLTTFWGPGLCTAQEAAAPTEQPVARKFPLPKPATAESLESFLEEMRTVRPVSPDEYQAMQVAIRDASKALIGMLDRKKDQALFQKIEFDAISSTVALMTTMTMEAREKSTKQIHDFLRKRSPLSIADVNTGLMAAVMLEMQPNKKPARETYELLVSILKDDKRPEFQGLQYVAAGSLRRLEMLGKPLGFSLKDLDGGPIDLTAYQGKYVIVYFFASDSQSCQRIVPQFSNYAKKYKETLQFIGISVDQDPAKVRAFVSENSISWPIALDNNPDLSQRLSFKNGVSALPLSMLLNKIGEVVSLEAHSAELDRLMQMLFESPTPAPMPEDSESKTPDSQDANKRKSLLEGGSKTTP